jgi:hypothetical protein
VKRSAEVLCSGKSAREELWVGDGCDGLGDTLGCSAVCLGKSAREELWVGDGCDGLGYMLCLVGVDGGM